VKVEITLGEAIYSEKSIATAAHLGKKSEEDRILAGTESKLSSAVKNCGVKMIQ
jgi:hypothetical protein